MNQNDEKKKEAVRNMLAGWFGSWMDAEPTKQTQSSNHGWISVDDKLPPTYLPVLVTMTDGKVWQGFLNDDEWYVYGWNKNPFTITHWQPLPEPPVCTGG